MLAEHDKHYPSRFGQTSLATARTNITKPCTKNFGPSILKNLCEPFLSPVANSPAADTKIDLTSPLWLPGEEMMFQVQGMLFPAPLPFGPISEKSNDVTSVRLSSGRGHR